MPPHAAQSSSTRKRPAPRDDDDVGDVVHVKPRSTSSTSLDPTTTHPQKKSNTLALGAGSRTTTTTTRTTRQSKTTTASSITMSASVKDGNPTPRVSRAKKGKRVHGCPHHGCDKIFTRAEHLRRHQLNHNTDVYFKCNMCDRTFVRHDLLSRHQERHNSQAIKAAHTLALHEKFSTHYGTLAGLSGHNPGNEYSNGPHGYEQSQHAVESMNHPLPSSSPHSTSSNISSGYPPMHTSDSSVGYQSSNSTPSPANIIGRGQLPYQLQQNEIQRQQDSYLSHADIVHRNQTSNLLGTQDQSIYVNSTVSSWDRNINWLLDESAEKPRFSMEEIPAVSYIHPLEMAYSRWIAHPPPEMSSVPPPPGVRDTSILFHLMDENTRNEILLLLGNVPNIQNSNFASLESMQQYLRIYWNNFHPLYPILHRPSFVPGMSLVCLAAIVIAIGASYADSDARQFGMALYDKVKALLINSNDYSAGTPNHLPIMQTLMLTDVFGKMRTTRDHFDGAQLDMILAGLLRRGGPPADALEHLRNLQRDGIDYHLETEWHRWIFMEGRKRIATMFYWWDVQQAVIFGREACQSAFELHVGLPSGKEEILWDSDCASDWITRVDTESDVPTFLGVLRYFFDSKKQIPHISPLASVYILHGLISVALDLKRNRIRNPEGSVEKQGRLLQAFERWRQHYEKTVAIHLRSPCHNKIMVMYHMAFVAMHTEIRPLLIVAGETRTFTRDTNHSASPHQQQQQQRMEYYHAKNEMTSWANSPNGQLATWHAVQILVRLYGEPGLVREQVHLPWMQYLSLLICWEYGNLLSNPHIPQGIIDDNGNNNMLIWNSQAAQHDMNSYLAEMNTHSWQDLAAARSVRRTTGLIMTIKEVWEGIHWGLLNQCSEILRSLASRNNKVGI